METSGHTDPRSRNFLREFTWQIADRGLTRKTFITYRGMHDPNRWPS